MLRLGSLLVLLAGCAAGGGPPRSNSVPVVTAAVVRGPVDDVLNATGEVQQPEEARIGAEVSGTIALVPGRVGAVVQKGDVLVVFDDQPFRIALESARARLAQSNASLQTRLVSRERVTLRSRGVLSVAAEAGGAVSGTEAEIARLDVREADASVLAAEADTLAAAATVAAAALDVQRTRVLAPFDGVIRDLQAVRGQRVGAGAPLMTVLGRGDVEVILDLARPGAAEGQTVTLGTSSQGVDGVVRGVVPGLSAARTQRVRVVVSAPPAWLLPGSVLPARIVLGQASDALSIPRDALTSGAVFVAKDGKAVKVPVSVRWDLGDTLVVDGALEGGDAVVVRGNEALTDGASVTVAGAPPPAAPIP